MTLIRESALAKRSHDIKGVCNTIISSLSRLVIIALMVMLSRYPYETLSLVFDI